MDGRPAPREELARQVEDLRARLEEAEETLRAIRAGEVDALVVHRDDGDKVFTLQGAERPYRILIEAMNEGAMTLSADGLVLYCNRHLAEVLRSSIERVMGAPFASFLVPEDRARFAEMLRGAPAGCSGEITCIAADGSRVAFALSLSGLPEGSGAAIGAVATDLKAQKRREVELRDAKERLDRRVAERTVALEESEKSHRLLIDLLPSGVLVHRDGRIVLANRSAARLLGAKGPEQLIGSAFVDRVHPEYRGLAGEHMRIPAGEARPAPMSEGMLLRIDGSGFHADVTGMPVQYEGTPAMLVLFNDVTDRRRAEEALREAHGDLEVRIRDRTAELDTAYGQILQQERQYRLLAENATDLIWTTDLGLRFEYVSPSSVRLLGRTAEEVREMNLREVLTPESFEAVAKGIAELVGAGQRDPQGPARQPWTMDLEVVCAGGGTVWTETTLLILRDSEGAAVGLLGDTRDITERRRLEAQLVQAQKMEALGTLAGGVAHDFNNMMQVVTGYSARILRRIPEGDPVREYVEEIQNAGARAATLTQQLLAFSRRQVLQPKVLDLNSVVTTMVRMLRSVLGEDVELVKKLEPRLWKVKVDPARIEQILMNLSSNARDAMPAGGTFTIETANAELGEHAGARPAVSPGSFVMLTVSDTGCGIDQGSLERVFEPFFTTKPPGKGTGLGLAMVYGTVEQSGGTIQVSSTPGEGTTFRICFPRVAAPEEGKQVALARKVPPGGSETVLVVEDEDSVRQLTAIELEELGYHVLQARSGDEARAESRRHAGQIDLLLCDVVLPGCSGPETYRWLAAERPDIRVLFMSGHAGERIRHHGALAASAPLLEKPFTAEHLAARVREVLAGPRPAAPGGGP